MQRKRSGAIEWLEFDILADIPRLKHAVFLRNGGHSKGAFSALNLSHHIGDDAESVEANLNEVKAILGIQTLISGKQCHGAAIAKVFPSTHGEIPGHDGFITNIPDIGLMIKHADCQAAILYDPIHHAISTVHSGWKGSVQNIYAAAIDRMKMEYETRPEDLLIGISPSLGPESAEFKNYRKELPEAFWKFQSKPNYFDFWAITHKQLLDCGVLSHHIEYARMCTLKGKEDFFSYRRENITGRHGTIAVLKK